MSPIPLVGQTVSERLGRCLRDWRVARRYPLKHIAVEMGVSVQVVSDWERGVRFPSARHLEAIERCSGMPICAFLHGGATACEYAETTPRPTVSGDA